MYQANLKRYEQMQYRQVGQSGLKLSVIGLGFWANFGNIDPFENQRQMVRQAFDLGITYYDLANNYGPEPGSAETNFGRIMAMDLKPYRDEMVIASKAGHRMWPGPYGDGGSRKSIIASAEQSLQRTGLDYFDIFYSHRPDPETPLEETALALDQLVRSGKALYVGISKYSGAQTAKMAALFADLHTPFIIHQPRYNLFERQPETDLFPVLTDLHKGAVGFSSLAQGLLTAKYLHGIPANSRAKQTTNPFLHPAQVTQTLDTVQALNQVAQQRGQSLAAMALAWNLRQPALASVLIGASRPEQITANVQALQHLDFTAAELTTIDRILAQQAPIQR
ncbi:aldo/keto reductase [Loigolactobacillus bifermentans]|jgi:L-glyceraldehyde 3-phosphate reductase|uniref:Oxidoreductase n=1 Tax=Loigolactobacillus bifermentans DSM 20003 TaxID=1423726 RepID=A0A0R1GEP7_9LACO|nr:aldo/keto reductase [Loigolactobacillus bifermentans]KRK32733.1 oxidoreductase [Loigolactobacillus bifermentans DSM 20003]QGG60037.1 L-glyceraldehyde 3-phosphate reductase [Loigolactobacillus bifermentans]